jgi:hypothetical protein
VKAGRFLDNRGAIGLRGIFWIVFLCLALYSGYKIGLPYFSYKMMYYEVRSEAENARLYNDEEIRNRILKKAEDWSVPLKSRDLRIDRRARFIDISLDYSVTITFFQRYNRTFYYDISVREPL